MLSACPSGAMMVFITYSFSFHDFKCDGKTHVDVMLHVCVQEQLEEHRPGLELEEGWILVCKHTEGGDRLVPVESPETVSRQQQLFGYDHKPCNRWEQVVNVENALYIGSKPKIAECDEAAVQKLR